MLVKKMINLRTILGFAGGHLIWLTMWITFVAVLYYFTQWKWMSIPWLPLSVLGTAVAFYVGFKNNQAYDRLWESRKIWGAIVNSSRMWAATVKAYTNNNQLTQKETDDIRRKLIHRQIAWVYILRQQMLSPTQWEHVSLRWHFGRINRQRREQYGVGAFKDEINEVDLKRYLSIEEYNNYLKFANIATQILDRQSQELARLNEQKIIDAYKQTELQRIINDLYDHQGKSERIKKFPLPRQYANLSFIFVCIFIFLLPFGMVGEFSKLGDIGMWLMIPFGVLVGWIYVVMELIGDYSENPFEGLVNDLPMFSICRTIEIDLLQMLGRTMCRHRYNPNMASLCKC